MYITLNGLSVDVTAYVDKEIKLDKPAAIIGAILTWCELVGVHPDMFEAKFNYHKEEVRKHKIEYLKSLSK